jgi:O-antigen ligase
MTQRETRPGIFGKALEITWLIVIFFIPLFFVPQLRQVFVLNKALLLEFLVIAMLGFWVAGLIQRPAIQRGLNWKSIFTSPLHLSILVFGLIAALSTIMSLTPAISFWGSYFRKAGLLTLICWILFFLIIAQQIRNRQQLLRAVYTLLISSGIVSIMGILQHFFPDAMMNLYQSTNTFGDRVTSTIGNPLFLSSFLAMVIPFNLALICYCGGKRKEHNNTKILTGLIILLALQFWCLWLAQYSITILLYIISAIIFVVILGIVKHWKLLLGVGAISLIVLVAIAGVLLAPLLFSTSEGQGVKTQESQPVPVSEGIGLETLQWRVEFWQGAADIFLKSPQVPFSDDKLHDLRRLIGYGPETFWLPFQLFFPDNLRISHIYNLVIVDRPHNDYLYLLNTVGLLGLLSFLSILVLFFYLCFKYMRRAIKDIDKLLLIAMVAAVAQYSADIFFNMSTISAELVFWLALAMTIVIGRFVLSKRPVIGETINKKRIETASLPSGNRVRFLLSLGCVLLLMLIGLGVTVRPFLADSYMKKGLDLETSGIGQAVYAYDAATRIEPGEAYYWHSLGAYEYYVARNLEQQSFRLRVIAIAAEDQNKAVRLKGYDAYEYYSLADMYTYWAWSGDTDKWPLALSLYDKATQLFPNNALIFDKWALALIAKGDFNSAGTKLIHASSVDPTWAESAFLTGLLLVIEGKDDEGSLKIISTIQDNPDNLNYFINVCRDLKTYGMTRPLDNAFEVYEAKSQSDWTVHALLAITGLFNNNLNIGLDECDTAVRLVPDKDAAALLRAILKLTSITPDFKKALPDVASNWRDKLSQSPNSEILLPLLDQLTARSE